jgi:DNA-binding beta-propeller fold protein YncE
MKSMTFFKNTLWAVLGTVIFTVIACTKGDEKPDTGYTSGVFISCEGAFTGGTGTVSFYNRTDSARSDIYAAANSGAKIGNVLQSYTAFQNVGYLVVNNANKMITVDPKTFVTTGTYDTGFILPRYALGVAPVAAGDAGRLYVSCYGKNGVDGSIKLFDLTAKKISRVIPTGKGTNKMILVGGRIWAVNDGGFGMDSTVVIVNAGSLVSDTIVEKRIKVGAAPKDIVADNNGNIWVLCSGYDFSLKQDQKASKLIQIRDDKVVATFDNLPSGAAALTLDNSKTTLYFVAGNKVYSKDPLSFSTIPPSVYLDNAAFKSLYGIGVDPKTGYLYVADALDFTASGQVYVYDLTTKTLKTVLKSGVGVAPNGFYFN